MKTVLAPVVVTKYLTSINLKEKTFILVQVSGVLVQGLVGPLFLGKNHHEEKCGRGKAARKQKEGRSTRERSQNKTCPSNPCPH